MPMKMRILRERNPDKFVEACRRGGIAAAAKKAKQSQIEDVLRAADEAKALIEENDLRASTNEHILTPDGEVIE
jgi:hypothetical protein